MTPRASARLGDAARALEALAAALERENVHSYARLVTDLAQVAVEPVDGDRAAEQRLVELHEKYTGLTDHKEGLSDVFFYRENHAEQVRVDRELDELRAAARAATEPTGRPRLRKHP